MKSKKESLQKFTKIEQKFENLFKQSTIGISDLENLTESERQLFDKEVIKRIKKNQGDNEATLSLLNKVNDVVPQYVRNQTWEYNHQTITQAIASCISDTGIMPDKNTIADKAGLTRQTIHKHLKEYAKHPLNIEHEEKFKLMTTKVMSKVLQLALKGDLKAAKIYLNMVIESETSNLRNSSIVHNQSNYIQINNLKIKTEEFEKLPTDTLEKIETLLKEFRN